jgi:hypothetical protein
MDGLGICVCSVGHCCCWCSLPYSCYQLHPRPAASTQLKSILTDQMLFLIQLGYKQ